MQKTIQFSGHTAVPSDHDAPDDTLAQAFNLSADTGMGLQPVGEPITIDSPRTGWIARFIHSLPSGGDAVVFLGADNALAYAMMVDERVGELSVIADSAFAADKVADIQFTAMGNILLVYAPQTGMRYYLWRGSNYQSLGNRPGFPALEFGLMCRANLTGESIEIKHAVKEAWSINNNGMQENTIVSTESSNTTTDSVYAFYQAITNGVYGKLYQAVTRKIQDRNLLFYQPFILRYAVRTFNGDYLWHSAPILMLPTTSIPMINVSQRPTEPRDLVYTVQASYENINLFALTYRIIRAGNLSVWRDIIAGIDVFVSAPFYTYDQTKTIEGFGSPQFCRGEMDSIGSTPKFRIEGIFSLGDTMPYKRHTRRNLSGDIFWRLPDRTSKLESDICDCHQFYRIARLEFDDILSSLGGELKDLPLEDGIDYSNLVTRPTLPDDFGSHRTLYPGVSYVYNSRLNLAGLQVLPPAALPIRSCLPYTNENPQADTAQKAIITRSRVAYKKNNRTYYRETTGTSGGNEYNPWLIDTFGPDKPLYLFVPDRDAYEITFWYRQGENAVESCVSFKLRPHDFLGGAYYYAGIFVPAVDIAPAERPAVDDSRPIELNSRYPFHNQLYASQVNNPFVFPAVNATTVGNGKIIALASAAKPLSQGQFGQYPLYAFTDEGVWALSLSDTGIFQARQPITRHVLLNPFSICTLDSAVAFIARQGLMLLSGSQVTSLSHIIDSLEIFSSAKFNGLDKLLPPKARYTLPLSIFAKTARIAYDNINSRIILYRTIDSYAYIYNIRSQLWTLMLSSIHHTLNSYPDTYAVDTRGAIIKPFRYGPGSNIVALITRPLKLDIPDGLKTLRQLYLRGQFRPGQVQCALYGSRDLIHWHLIASSRDHRIRRISGTPYKYFTIAAIGYLNATESITSADIDYIPRYNNRLR